MDQKDREIIQSLLKKLDENEKDLTLEIKYLKERLSSPLIFDMHHGSIIGFGLDDD